MQLCYKARNYYKVGQYKSPWSCNTILRETGKSTGFRQPTLLIPEKAKFCYNHKLIRFINSIFLFAWNLPKINRKFSKLESSKNLHSKLIKNKCLGYAIYVNCNWDYKLIIHYMETFNWLLKIYTGIGPNRLLTSI